MRTSITAECFLKDMESNCNMKENERKKDYSISVIQKFEEIEKIRDFWEENQWHPYTDIDYYIAFASSYRGFVRPHIILLSRNDRPKTLVIGWIQEKNLNFKIGYKNIFRAKTRALHIEYAGILGDACHSNCAAIVEEIMNLLKSGEVEVAFFKFIKHESPIFKMATSMPSFLCRDYHPVINLHWAISMPESFDELVRRFSRTTRKKLRRQNNLINKEFKDNLCVKCFRTVDDLESALADVETIAHRW